jgi:hypothetical protein
MSGLELGSQPIEPKLVWEVCSSKKEPRLALRFRGAKNHLYVHDHLRKHNGARLQGKFCVHVWKMEKQKTQI